MSRNRPDRKSTRLNSSHGYISYAVFCLKKKNNKESNNTELSKIETDAAVRRLVASCTELAVVSGAGVETVTHLLACYFFFFNDTATTEIYTLSLHDALPICRLRGRQVRAGRLDAQPEERDRAGRAARPRQRGLPRLDGVADDARFRRGGSGAACLADDGAAQGRPTRGRGPAGRGALLRRAVRSRHRADR